MSDWKPNVVNELKWHVQKVFPSVYDDSLSYYELLSKVIAKLNELIEQSNEYFSQDLKTYLKEILQEMKDGGDFSDLVALIIVPEIMNKINGITDVREFGAIGDGVTDDTEAIQLALNSGKRNIAIREGNYLITSELICNTDGVNIRTDGATLVCGATTDINMLRVNGSNSTISLDIDGKNLAYGGIDVYGDECLIKGCNIRNIYGVRYGSFGIRVTTRNGVTISENIINNVTATSNSTLGDNVGSARGILLTNTAAALKGSLITNNRVSYITGEEGDAVQILFYDGVTFPFLDAKTTIVSNTIIGFNRRGLKIQASNVNIVGNQIDSLLNTDLTPNAVACVNAFTLDGILLSGNSINSNGGFVGVQITGTATNLTRNVSIKDNKIKIATDKNAIYMDYLDTPSIVNNTIDGGISSIGFGNCRNAVIVNNTLIGGTDNTSQTAINCLASNTSPLIRGNILFGQRVYLLQLHAPNSIVENNHSRGDAGNIRVYSTATNGYLVGNTNLSGSPTIIGDYTNCVVGQTKNMGTGPTNSGSVSFASAIPSTSQPNSRHNIGDIVFNTAATSGANVGWVCTSGGNPGAWVPFGTIQ